jgi:hypothetical protein
MSRYIPSFISTAADTSYLVTSAKKSRNASLPSCPTSHTLQNCRDFAGKPLSRDQAGAKMERSPLFRQAVLDFEQSGLDVVDSAIQLDYGIRLRSCLMERPTTSRKVKITPYSNTS